MALSALAGLLAGTKSLQQDQQQQQQQKQPQEQLQQQQPQQLLRPGQKPLGHPQAQQQQQLQALTSQARKQPPPPQQQQQQQPHISISQDVALKLQVAIIQMLENEEKQLQGCFKQHYTAKLQQLQHGQPLQPLDFTADPPKDVVQSPLSPKVVYHPEESQHSQQQQQQQVTVDARHIGTLCT
jgi:hypothetical protein